MRRLGARRQQLKSSKGRFPGTGFVSRSGSIRIFEADPLSASQSAGCNQCRRLTQNKSLWCLDVFTFSVCVMLHTAAEFPSLNIPSVTIATDRLLCYLHVLLQGERAAICTDNVTDMSSKDDRGDSAQFVNSVDSFICQSTIIPADGRGFRMAISSQSTSLADTFIGVTLERQ